MEGWSRVHAECAKGDQQSNIAYCTKLPRVEPFVEWGDKMQPGAKPGKNVGIKRALDIIKGGGGMKDVLETEGEVFVKNWKGLEVAMNLLAPKRTWKTEVFVLYGKAGTGKSWKARHDAGADAWYMPRSGGTQVWFDGYSGQENVVIEEFYGWIPLQMMLELLDETPIRCPIKGGFVYWKPKKIFITSNANPEIWYANAFLKNAEHKVALFRRIEHILEFTAYRQFTLTHPAADHRVAIQGEAKINDVEECGTCGGNLYDCQGNCVDQLNESPKQAAAPLPPPALPPVIPPPPMKGLTILEAIKLPVGIDWLCGETLLTKDEEWLEVERRMSVLQIMKDEFYRKVFPKTHWGIPSETAIAFSNNRNVFIL